MLDTPPQDKLHKHLQICNACEHSCIMMIMVGSQTNDGPVERWMDAVWGPPHTAAIHRSRGII